MCVVGISFADEYVYNRIDLRKEFYMTENYYGLDFVFGITFCDFTMKFYDPLTM